MATASLSNAGYTVDTRRKTYKSRGLSFWGEAYLDGVFQYAIGPFMHRSDALDAARDWIKTKQACDATPAGLQIVLPGAEVVPQAVLAQRRANAPLKPKTAQRPCDVGLFSDEADQLDLVSFFTEQSEE